MNRGAWIRPILDGMTLAGVMVGLFYIVTLGDGRPVDVHAYFAVNLAHPYAGSQLNGTDAYLYSPAFAQATEPLRALGWETFRTTWRVVELGVLAALAGPLTLPLVFLSPVASEINAGNVHLLMALAVVAGFRWPAAWAFILLTKVTPGVGLLWFAVRREWRSLGIALGVTAGIASASFVLAPGLWADWIRLLAAEGSVPARTSWEVVMLPLAWRIAIAAAVVVWGARNDRRWAVPIAVFLASPATYWQTLTILVAVLPLAFPPGVRYFGTASPRRAVRGAGVTVTARVVEDPA